MRPGAAALVLAIALSTLANADDDLSGLWKAKKRFGPDVRGTLVIERSGDAYHADLAGQRIAVTSSNGELAFREFRGRVRPDKTILGYWLKRPSPIDGDLASPVILRPDGANRWRGVLDPVQDECTFFLLLQKRPDGTMSALLRNVERDIGTQFAVDRLVRDGNSLKLLGSRGGKDIEVARGAYDAETGFLTLFFPNRGGSYDFARETGESDFYPRGAKPARYSYRAPASLDDGWPVGTLGEANINRGAIENLVQSILETPMDSRDAPQVHALLIARHGKLVVEEYFHGEHRERLHNTRSAAKSVTSVIAGAAIFAGAPLSLDSRVYEVMNGGAFPDGLEAGKRTMTLEHLLTMSSGYFCDDTDDAAPGNEEKMEDQTDEPDYYRFTMRVPLVTPPGENSVYCSASPNLALGMVGKALGESPMDTFERLVAQPMKIHRYAWGLDPAGNPYGGGSMRLAARDFAKFGQLMLDGGAWQGHRILATTFAKEAASPQYHLRNISYGYLWWGEEYPYKSRSVYAYSARGTGGQTITVVPELDLVIATMAGNYFSRKGMGAASLDMVPRSILPAVRETGDDPNAPVIEREYKSPYGASKDGSRVKRR